MAESTPPRRRWFQFGLRTMFVVVTVFAVWLGLELNYIHERKAMRESPLSQGTAMPASDWVQAVAMSRPSSPRISPPKIPFWREWLGDEAVGYIRIKSDEPESDDKRAAYLFPEAEREIVDATKSDGFFIYSSTPGSPKRAP